MIPRRILFRPAARRAWESLGDDARQRIGHRLALFAGQGVGNVRKLEGRSNEWRLRIGRWRVIFTDRKDIY